MTSNLFSDNSIKIKINEITKSWTVHIPFFAYCITNFLILKYFYIDKNMWPLSFQCWHNLKFIHITLSLQISRFSSQFSWYRFDLPKFDCIALPVCISFCGPLHIYNFRYCCHPHLLQLPRLSPFGPLTFSLSTRWPHFENLKLRAVEIACIRKWIRMANK